ncbi:MAG: hypothetical protein D6819_07855, partial [Gammaproteobacteria bacterium]
MSVDVEKIVELLKDMPEEQAQEVLDFAEFVYARHCLDETAYLLKDPANRQRLLEAVANIRAGKHVE